MDEMQKFFDQVKKEYGDKPINILDVGSAAINSTQTYRTLIMDPGWSYTGVDLVPGINVNYALNGRRSLPYSCETFDVVISGQCLEHCPTPWVLVPKIAELLKEGGLMCIIAPHTFRHHTEGGDDCWRIWPAGMRGLFETSSVLKVVDVYKNAIDTVGIARRVR
jgi:SAM-dependent methyltransferase